MKQVPSVDFRKQYASINEPVEVTTHGQVIAYFIPVGFPFRLGAGEDDEANLNTFEPEIPATPERFSIRPVKPNPRGPLSGTEKRILDPIEKGDKEREVYAQLRAKMSASEGSRQR